MIRIDAGEKKTHIVRIKMKDADPIPRTDMDLWIYYPHAQSGRNVIRSNVSQAFASGAVDLAKNTITIEEHGLVDGDVMQLTTTGTLPAPLAVLTDYYVVESTKDTFKLSATKGGSAIDLTVTGSGVVPAMGVTGAGAVDFGKWSVELPVDVTKALKKGVGQAVRVKFETPTIGPEIVEKAGVYSVY